MTQDTVFDPSTVNDEVPDDRQLTSVSRLADEAKQLEAEIVDQTKRLRVKLTRYRDLTARELPQALARIGMSDFSLENGTRIGLVTKLDGKQLTSPEGLRWVEANGGSSIIKTMITIELDRGDVEAAREIVNELRAHRAANRFRGLSLEEVIPAQTIAKFARELIEAGKDPPLQLLGVHRRAYAVVGKRPKTVDLKGFTDER